MGKPCLDCGGDAVWTVFWYSGIKRELCNPCVKRATVSDDWPYKVRKIVMRRNLARFEQQRLDL